MLVRHLQFLSNPPCLLPQRQKLQERHVFLRRPFRSREVRRCLHKALKDGMRHKQPVRRAQATPDMPSMTDNICKHSHRDDVSMALPGSKLSKLFKLCPPRFIPKSRKAPQIRQRQQTVCLDKQTSVARKGHVASQAAIWGDKETPPAAWHGRNVGGAGVCQLPCGLGRCAWTS